MIVPFLARHAPPQKVDGAKLGLPGDSVRPARGSNGHSRVTQSSFAAKKRQTFATAFD
jgi:hypothetical protein